MKHHLATLALVATLVGLFLSVVYGAGAVVNNAISHAESAASDSTH